jgi:hypothetical protein
MNVTFTVNNIKIPIYQLDTIKSIKNRIVATLQTIPEYIIGLDELPLNVKDYENNSFNVLDLKKEILSYNSVSFFNFVKKLNLIPTLNLAEIFVRLKSTEFLNSSNKDYNQLIVDQELKTMKINDDTLTILRRDVVIKDFKTYIKQNDQFVKNAVMFETVENTEITDVYTDSNSIEFSILADNTYSAAEIFNDVIVNNFIPLCIYKDFKKILPTIDCRHIVPIIEDDKMKSIYFYIYKYPKFKSHRSFDLDNFSLCSIKHIKDDEFLCSIKETWNLSFEHITDKVRNLFSTALTFGDKTVLSSSGFIFVPDFSVNSQIFIDAMLNIPLMSYFLTCNENRKSLKNKYSIYAAFGNSPQISLIFTPDIVKRNDAALKDFSIDKEKFAIGSFYFKIRILQFSDDELYKSFIYVVKKLLTIFKNKQVDITREYLENVPNFSEHSINILDEEIIERYLKDYDPEIFLPGYQRDVCQHVPKVTEEPEKYNPSQVLAFPKNNPRNYVCDDPEYKFIGVSQNSLENKQEYPWLPCCYRNDQSKNIKLLKYHSSYIDNDNLNADKGYVIKTNKFVDSGSFGVIPSFINSILSLSFSKQFYRAGVKNTRYSFVECVHKAINGLESTLDIENILNDLFSKISMNVCKQENYDKTIDDIKANLENSYIDPSLYIKLFEKYYNCRIILFTRTKNCLDGDFLIPRYIHNYYFESYNEDIPVIMIYEHKSTSLKDPQRCEFLILDKKQSKFKLEEIQEVVDLYLKRFEFLLSGQVQDIRDLNDDKTPLIKYQHIDGSGKTRILRYDFGDVLIEPIAPLNIDSITDINIRLIDLSDLINTNIKIVQKFNDNGKIWKLKVVIGNVDGFVYLKNIDNIIDSETVDMEQSSDLFNTTINSAMESYVIKEKYNRCLLEFVLYKFSQVLDGNIPAINNIDLFLKNNTIQESINNLNVNLTPYINDLSAIFQKDDKVKIPSRTIVENFLKNYITRNMIEYIINYKNRKTIDNYFISLSDFKISKSQNLIKICSPHIESIQNVMYTTVFETSDLFYFRHESLYRQLYLACKTTSLEIALYIAQQWFINHEVDIPSKIPDKPKMSFTFYNFKSSINVDKYEIKGTNVKNIKDIEILGYKKSGIIYYISLLRII